MTDVPSPLARAIARLGLAALLAAAAGPGLAAGGGGHGGGGSGGQHGGDIRIRGGRAGGGAAGGFGGAPGRMGAGEGRAYAGPGDGRYDGAGRRQLQELAGRELRLRTSRCDRTIAERNNAPHSCNDSPPLGRFPPSVGGEGF